MIEFLRLPNNWPLWTHLLISLYFHALVERWLKVMSMHWETYWSAIESLSRLHFFLLSDTLLFSMMMVMVMMLVGLLMLLGLLFYLILLQRIVKSFIHIQIWRYFLWLIFVYLMDRVLFFGWGSRRIIETTLVCYISHWKSKTFD